MSIKSNGVFELDVQDGLLTLAQEEILYQLYEIRSLYRLDVGTAESRSIKRITVKGELGGGFSGARVLIVMLTNYQNIDLPERVVKIGSRVMLETERDNYINFGHGSETGRVRLTLWVESQQGKRIIG